ncbi:MAG: tryptophan--tRNA ligase [Candidatus Wildermuthbacteria bacterium]|nr:tryptophan--tRNA ligase [Candidatus Wildermuthbacteria bacterium]
MRILSGIQPTGEMHIGNYLGAWKRLVELQTSNECFYMIADLHALTVPQKANELAQATLQKAVELLSIGIDPEHSTLFVQSHVSAHTELAWILNTLTPLGELERMTQFKEKSKKYRANINAGLLDYPVLQAADILLYLPDGVPVGKDQIQHVELTRELAKRFNATYGAIFKEPKALVAKEEEGAKIMSLKDPKKKMSKSDPPDTWIGIFEDEGIIKRKIASATTDSGKDVAYNPAKKPGISNLLTIYSLVAEQPIRAVEKKFQKKGYAPFKKAVAELLISKLRPLRSEKKQLESREVYLREILRQGAKKANAVASRTMEEARRKVGFLQI